MQTGPLPKVDGRIHHSLVHHWHIYVCWHGSKVELITRRVSSELVASGLSARSIYAAARIARQPCAPDMHSVQRCSRGTACAAPTKAQLQPSSSSTHSGLPILHQNLATQCHACDAESTCEHRLFAQRLGRGACWAYEEGSGLGNGAAGLGCHRAAGGMLKVLSSAILLEYGHSCPACQTLVLDIREKSRLVA